MFQGILKGLSRKVQELFKEISGSAQGCLKKVKKKIWSKIFLVQNFFLTNFLVQKIPGQKNFSVQHISAKKYFCPKKFWLKDNILGNKIW